MMYVCRLSIARSNPAGDYRRAKTIFTKKKKNCILLNEFRKKHTPYGRRTLVMSCADVCMGKKSGAWNFILL